MHEFEWEPRCCLGGLGDVLLIEWLESIVTAMDKGLRKGSHDQARGSGGNVRIHDEAEIDHQSAY